MHVYFYIYHIRRIFKFLKKGWLSAISKVVHMFSKMEQWFSQLTHYCSVISKLYFRKHHKIFEIFVNFVFRKFLRIQYTSFIRIMALLSILNVRHCKSFPVKTLFGGIHKSLTQRIFPCLWQTLGWHIVIDHSKIMASQFRLLVADYNLIARYQFCEQTDPLTCYRAFINQRL